MKKGSSLTPQSVVGYQITDSSFLTDQYLGRPRSLLSTITSASNNAYAQITGKDCIDFFCTAIVDSSTKSFSVTAWESTEFRTWLTSWALQKEADIAELKSVTRWQKHRLDYQAVYTAYLMGATTEDDYLRDSEQYICELKQIDSEKIREAIGRLERLLDFKISMADLADYLNTDPALVKTAILSGLQKNEISQDAVSKLIAY